MTTKIQNSTLFQRSRSFALLLAVTVACSSSFAEKPEWAGGGGKGDKQDKHEQKHKQKDGNKHDDGRHNDHQGNVQTNRAPQNNYGSRQVTVGGYFGDPQRVVINNYYGNEFKAGRCPPGLAKKNNGCMPPGQAKKYQVGQRLPSNVVYYAVPQQVAYQLGAPPSGYRYVRVASDILLLAVGTSMVVDAIQNLNSY